MTLRILSRFKSIPTVVLIFYCLVAAGCASQRITAPATAAQEIDAIFEDYFEAYLKLFPTIASEIGDHRYDDRLEIAIGAEHLAAQKALATETLGRMNRIDSQSLDPQRRLYYDLLRYNLNDTLAGLEFQQHLLPVRQLLSLAVEFPLLATASGIHPFRTVQDYDNFLRRMKAFEGWIDTAIGNMRRGIESGIIQPRSVVERTLPQLQSMIATDSTASLLYRPISRMPPNFSGIDRERLRRAYADAIEHSLVPAYRRLIDFLRAEYLPMSRNGVAWSELPGGAAWYDYLIRNQTTTALTAEAIFDLGMKEIARIKNVMESIRLASGFSGSLGDFARDLTEKAPRGHASRAELISGYESIRHAIAPNLEKLFGRIPRAQFEVRTIEEYREQSAPSQYWSAAPDGSRPGIFYVNARGIENNPRRVSEGLFLHEAIPGHHFQISLQREQSGLPRFQRFADYAAFTEGWALYAEGLGTELGLYRDPSQFLSRLNSELFRAVRLVVDVGLHRKQWSRQQAIDFIVDTTGGGESGASLEVDRYIAMPGQALSYKIGQLKITAIRAKAETALGAKFDIRAFHDELLKDGALPLDILEAKMDRWIAQNRQ